MKMTDSELCALIDRQCENAIGSDDFYALQRQRAMEFYLGEAKGELAPPEVDGRSRVVSKDLMDTVEWAMPALMRMFASADDICRFEPENPEDEKGCDDATQYIGYLIHRKNNGFTVLHDAIKSSLIARVGIVKVYCDKSWDEREERYEGCSQVDVEALQSDPEIEVVSVEPYGVVPPAGVVDGMPPEFAQTFTIIAKRRTEVMNFRCVGVPPEEFRINKDARNVEDAEFVAHEVERTASQLISEGWPKDEVKKLPKGRDYRQEGDELARHDYDGSWDYSADEGDESQQKIVVTEAYVKVDTNDDGVSEFRRVVKAGTYIHENEITDDHPFALFTPILMPYKVIGLGMWDLVEDLQRIKTTLTRQVLDNVYLSNNPRTEVVEGQVNLDDLLQPRPGGVVRVKVANSTRAISTPFVAGAGLQLIEFIDAVRDTRTGVTEMNSALNAEALSKSSVGSEGVQAMMANGAQRMELIARVLAEGGVKRLYLLMLKLVTQYQNRPQQVKINGRWLEIDPREWKNRYDMTVSIGIGHSSRQQQVANLTMLGQAQEKVLPLGLATPQNIYQTLTRLAEAMGFKDSDQFFSPPQPPQPPGPSPELQIEQMKQQGAQQLAQFKGQVDIQVEQMRQRAQAEQAQQETSLEAQRNAQEMQNNMALEQYKVDKQIELETYKAQLAANTELEKARMSAQASLVSAYNQPSEAA